MNGLEALSFLAQRDVQVTMVDANTFLVDGFYKSGTVRVNIVSNSFEARYDEVTEVPEWSNLLEQLIWSNEEWQERSAYRHDAWKEMDERWVKVQEDYEELKKT